MNFAGDAAGPPGPRGDVLTKTTTRSGSGMPTGLNSTALTTEKIAVLAPMPSVMAATAASVNAGLWRNIRSECFKSLKNDSIRTLDAARPRFVDVLLEFAQCTPQRARFFWPDRRWFSFRVRLGPSVRPSRR